MPDTSSRQRMIDQLITAARDDPRIVGLLDYGSSSEGRLDEWSDIDVAVFIRDADYTSFHETWQQWAAQFGDLLLAYVGHIGHPWTVYDAGATLLRVDFDMIRESDVATLPDWPNSPTSVEAMLLYDGTGGSLRRQVTAIVGTSLAPDAPQAEFTRLSGDLYYHLHYSYSKLQRGAYWAARQAFHREVLEPLLFLLRMEAGAFTNWQGSHPAFGIETDVQPDTLVRLNACIPGPAPDGLRPAMLNATILGTATCASIANQHDWTWPIELASRIEDLLRYEMQH